MAVVKKDTADTFFLTYLDQVEKSSPDLLKAEEMPEKEALEALQDKKIKGIYYVGKDPSLTVAGMEWKRVFSRQFLTAVGIPEQPSPTL